MQSCAALGFDKDPFKIKSDSTIERSIIHDSGLASLQGPPGDLPQCKDYGKPALIGGSRNHAHRKAEKKQMILRFVYALAGGLGLLAPMLIMVYVPGTTASMATTCAFMLVFALGLAWFSDAQPREILTISAGYAAVLVVFVGVRITPSVGWYMRASPVSHSKAPGMGKADRSAELL